MNTDLKVANLVNVKTTEVRPYSAEQAAQAQSFATGLESFHLRLHMMPEGMNPVEMNPQADAILSELVHSGSSWGLLFDPSEKENVLQSVDDAIAGRGSVNIELTFYRNGKMTERYVGAVKKQRDDAYARWQEQRA